MSNGELPQKKTTYAELERETWGSRFAANRARARLGDDEEDYVVEPGANNRFVIVPKSTDGNGAAKKRAKAPKAGKAPSKAAKRPKAQKAAKADPAPRKLGKRAAIEEAAKAGKVPAPPDFSAETHTRFRPKLGELVALVKAKDVKGLKAYPINPISTSPKAMDRYRRLSVIALEAQAKGE